jgi:hypothetical protein
VRDLTGLRALHIRFYFSKIRFTYVAHVRSGGYRPVKADRLFEKQRVDDTYYYLVWQMWRASAIESQPCQRLG